MSSSRWVSAAIILASAAGVVSSAVASASDAPIARAATGGDSAIATAAVSATASASSATTAVGVSEREWSITAYRRAVRPGRVRFNVTNFGEDAHNLELRGPNGFRRGPTPDILAAGRSTLTVRLWRPGTYRLLCTKPGHVRLGMSARLVVRR